MKNFAPAPAPDIAIDATFIEPTPAERPKEQPPEWPVILHGRRDWAGRASGSVSRWTDDAPVYLREEEAEKRAQLAADYARALAIDEYRALAERYKQIAASALASAEWHARDAVQLRDDLEEAQLYNKFFGWGCAAMIGFTLAGIAFVNWGL